MSNANHATVRIQFPDANAAETALQSLAPDNDGFIQATRNDAELLLEARADSIMSLLRTLDDAMGCLRATGIE